jgi:hypothetical protein
MNTLCPHAEEHRCAAFAAQRCVSKHEAIQAQADLVLRDARTQSACALLRMRSERTPRQLPDEVIE